MLALFLALYGLVALLVAVLALRSPAHSRRVYAVIGTLIVSALWPLLGLFALVMLALAERSAASEGR